MTTFTPDSVANPARPLAKLVLADGTELPVHLDLVEHESTVDSRVGLHASGYAVWPSPLDNETHHATVDFRVPYWSASARALMSTFGTFTEGAS